MVDLERRLRDYGTELDKALHTVTADEIYLLADGFESRLHAPTRPRWTPIRVALVAALAALLLFLPILLLRDSTEPPVIDDPVTTTAPAPGTSVPLTTTTQSAGPEATSFVSETSLGNIEWTRVELDQRIQPGVSVDGVIQGVVLDDRFEVVGYVQSTDAIAWEPIETPEIPIWSYVQVGEEVLAPVSPDSWGVSMGPISSRQVFFKDYDEDPDADATLLRQEGAEWVPVALPASEPAPIPGLEILGPRFAGVAGKDDSNWVAPLMYLVRVPWSDVYGTVPIPDPITSEMVETPPWPIWNEGLQVLEIFQAGSDPSTRGEILASLTVDLVQSDPPNIEFRDSTTGDLVHTVEATLPGWTPEELLVGLRGWGIHEVSFVVSNDGVVSLMRPPWPMGQEWGESGIIESSGRYYTNTLTLGEDYSATAIHLWESEDGLTWNEVDLPQLHEGPIDYVTVAGGGGRLLMIITEMGGSGTVWTSTDGRDWTEADVDGELTYFAESTDFGWLMHAYDKVSISGDGLTWEHLDLPGDPAEPNVSYLDGIFVLDPLVEGTPRVRWVGRFAD